MVVLDFENFDFKKILEKHIHPKKNISNYNVNQTTPIVQNTTIGQSIFFKDDHYQEKEYIPIMTIANMENEIKFLPSFVSKIRCWNCRMEFSGMPFGMPVKYIPKTKNNNISKHGYFETEGIFCDLSCVKGYILSEIEKSKIRKNYDSLNLLSLLQRKLYGTKKYIPKKHIDWKVYKEWGGPVSQIDKNEKYIETINYEKVSPENIFFTRSEIFEKKYKDTTSK